MVDAAALRPGVLTLESLDDLVRELEGRPLRTVTGRGFTVGMSRVGPFFTPDSSGWGQSDGRKAIARFVDRYNATGSLRPADYGDVTRSASYLVAMLRHALEIDE